MVALLFLPAMLAMSANVAAQTKPARTEAGAEPVRSILWVGNSFFYYNNSMHNHVANWSARRAQSDGTAHLG